MVSHEADTVKLAALLPLLPNPGSLSLRAGVEMQSLAWLAVGYIV